VELRMSRKERERLKVVAQVAEGRLKQVEAARLMKLTVRHVRRLQDRYDAQGDAGLVHRSRGRPSNRRIPAARRREVLQRVRAAYADFGPTLAAEKLAQRDGLHVSRETLRGWMVEDGLWKVRRPAREVHLWRPRRSCAGELVQMDTSEHDWFEGRGDAEPVLITLIDDATNQTESRFYDGDTTKANLEVIGRYVRRYGVPLNTYADRKSLFKALRPTTTEEALAGREPESQVARAMRKLGMPYIPAGSPQAKGRVERSFQTDQDRLVKELRLAGISTIEAANRFLEETYLPERNRRFSVRPASSVDAHRSAAGLNLASILSVQTWRSVASDYTVRHAGRRYQIKRRSIRRGLRGSKVLVEERLDGSIKLRWRGGYLKYHPLPAAASRPSAPAPAPRRERRASATYERAGGSSAAAARRPAADHPWRQPFQKRTVLLCTKEDISTLR
jgi:transposase